MSTYNGKGIADTLTEAGKRAQAYLGSPAGRRVRRGVATAVIIGSPLIFRIPRLRKHWVVRVFELVGGAALIVAVAERVRDWEPEPAWDPFPD